MTIKERNNLGNNLEWQNLDNVNLEGGMLS